MKDNVDRIRRTALDQAEASERSGLWLLVAAAVVEVVGLALYLYLMDFSNRLHWLILIAAGLVYGTLALASSAMAAELKASARRILRAVEEIAGAESG